MKLFRLRSRVGVSIIITLAALSARGSDLFDLSSAESSAGLQSEKSSLWSGGVGEGFVRSAQRFSIAAGAGPGAAILGTSTPHDLALVSLTYGHIWGDVKGEGHFYRGNFEWSLELFGGGQFDPDDNYLIGLTPHLRYDFATGTRWVPFCDLGAGLSLTGIRDRDLGGLFEFNLQVGGGVNYFVKDNFAVSLESRYFHLSSASIYDHNHGANSFVFMLGANWFF